MAFKVVLDPRAIEDIQESIDFYEDQEPGLGKRFESLLHHHLTTISKSPYFQVRYDDVHCLPLKKFPHMIHYTIDREKKIIQVMAVFHTSLNPEKWEKRKE
jgi:toxin ParE1/3/4